MIIARKGFKNAFLVFAANGEIRLNKKTIGLWKVRHRRTYTDDYRLYSSIPEFWADVNYNRNSRVSMRDNRKLNLMLKVARNMPDNMLTRLAND